MLAFAAFLTYDNIWLKHRTSEGKNTDRKFGVELSGINLHKGKKGESVHFVCPHFVMFGDRELVMSIIRHGIFAREDEKNAF